MYIDQELIKKYNEKKSRGTQKQLIEITKMHQPVMSLALQGRYPVNKVRCALIKEFIDKL